MLLVCDEILCGQEFFTRRKTTILRGQPENISARKSHCTMCCVCVVCVYMSCIVNAFAFRLDHLVSSQLFLASSKHFGPSAWLNDRLVKKYTHEWDLYLRPLPYHQQPKPTIPPHTPTATATKTTPPTATSNASPRVSRLIILISLQIFFSTDLDIY